MRQATIVEPGRDLDLGEITERYRRDGVVVLRGFLDADRLVGPFQDQIRTMIELARGERGLGPPADDLFDAGLSDLLEVDRPAVAQIYDAVRKLPGFFAIASDPEVWSLVRGLMATDLPGWYAQGSGVRMDHPGEQRFLSPWHQEYPTHLNSLDMLTLWTPLVPVDDLAGPVIFCPGSHATGVMPVHLDDPLNARRNGAAAIEIVDIERHLQQHPQTSVETEPGDVVALHGLTLHRSSPNRSSRTRWSMQLRYFNYRDPTGRRIGWAGGMHAQIDLADVHPEVVVERPAS